MLVAPEVSYSHFFTMDFMVLDPPINFLVDFCTAVHTKMDCNVIAAALAAVGAVCRMNRFCVDARHHTRGGAGRGAERRKQDEKGKPVADPSLGRESIPREPAPKGRGRGVASHLPW